ncbi:putative Caspase-2 [Hypsibius exemplaris]|uniref:Caspase-2 n=1 Tax=Hypsibius exemplaris TaxID=2072580 RepID=A0A1W0WF58_HYPEX|nr:putative Caspase-2 [Hypsibius exemplaris]
MERLRIADQPDDRNVEVDADHPRVGSAQKYPWPSSPTQTESTQQPQSFPKSDTRKLEHFEPGLTTEENTKLVACLGKLTNWLAGQACQKIPVPEDVRTLVEKLPGSKELFGQGKPLLFLDRLADLGAVTVDFREKYIVMSPSSQEEKRKDFFDYLFRKGMRAVLNFAKMLYEDKKLLDVIKIVEHISNRGYIPAENVTARTDKPGGSPESSTAPTAVVVKKGHYKGGSRIYEMSSNPRGYVLIINNEKFHEGTPYTERRGTALDGDNLKALFVQIGFKIYEEQQFRDQTKKEMEVLVQRFASDKRHAHVHASVVCVLSHGKENGRIAGVDGQHITDVEIERNFTASSAPGLAGKPKLFFFVACRGNLWDNGLTVVKDAHGNIVAPATTFPLARGMAVHTDGGVESDAVSGGDLLVMSSNCDEQRTPAQDPRKIPDFTDFLSVYATIPGHISYRNTQEGTFFVKEFVNLVSEEACWNDLLMMITEVNNRLNDITYKGETQTCYTVTRLRKALFLNPGYNISPEA